jgi:hypothetical protein
MAEKKIKIQPFRMPVIHLNYWQKFAANVMVWAQERGYATQTMVEDEAEVSRGLISRLKAGHGIEYASAIKLVEHFRKDKRSLPQPLRGKDVKKSDKTKVATEAKTESLQPPADPISEFTQKIGQELNELVALLVQQQLTKTSLAPQESVNQDNGHRVAQLEQELKDTKEQLSGAILEQTSLSGIITARKEEISCLTRQLETTKNELTQICDQEKELRVQLRRAEARVNHLEIQQTGDHKTLLSDNDNDPETLLLRNAELEGLLADYERTDRNCVRREEQLDRREEELISREQAITQTSKSALPGPSTTLLREWPDEVNARVNLLDHILSYLATLDSEVSQIIKETLGQTFPIILDSLKDHLPDLNRINNNCPEMRRHVIELRLLLIEQIHKARDINHAKTNNNDKIEITLGQIPSLLVIMKDLINYDLSQSGLADAFAGRCSVGPTDDGSVSKTRLRTTVTACFGNLNLLLLAMAQFAKEKKIIQQGGTAVRDLKQLVDQLAPKSTKTIRTG